MSLEISFRRFDAFFGAMNQDPVAAEENIHRHIRYAEAHGLPTNTFLKPLLELVRAIDAGKLRAEEIKNKHSEAMPVKHHRLMLESVYRKYFQ